MGTSLFKRLLAYFSILILFSLATVGAAVYWQSSSALDKQSEQYIAQVINNTSYKTDLYLQTYERLSTSILINTYVKRFLDVEPTDYYGRYEYTREIKNVLSQPFNTYPQMNLVYIMGYNGASLFYDGQGLADTSTLDKDAHLQQMRELTADTGQFSLIKGSVLKRNEHNTITLARKIRGVSSYIPNGVLAIEIDSSKIEEVWKNVELAKNGHFFILDSESQVVYQPSSMSSTDSNTIGSANNGISKSDFGDSSLTESFIATIKEHPEEQFITTVAGEKWLIVSRTSEYSEWRLVMALPLSELRSPISTIRTTSIIVGIIVLIAALLLAYRFSRSITKPIHILRNGMRETVKGNWQQIHYHHKSRDEIGGLVHSYNIMVTRLEEMIDQVYKVELNNSKQALELQTLDNEKKSLELQALQLQINPHFLYNTLETINCYAIVKDSDEISEIVEAMAYMLRYSLQTQLDEITVANELNHVRNYLSILKHRIQREFELEIHIPSELLLEKMVRLTLQPLVENIFQHAFPHGIESYHSISIGAQYTEQFFQVIVEDNGVGIPAGKLEQLRAQLMRSEGMLADNEQAARRGKGIGIMNVHRRIQMVFGHEYGLHIESTEHQGTRMIMCMPKLRDLNRGGNKDENSNNRLLERNDGAS